MENLPSLLPGLALLEQHRPTLVQMAIAFMPADATEQQAIRRVTREIANVEQWLMMKPELQGCKKESLVYAVKQCIQDGLTLAPGSDLAYLIPSRIKTGQNGSQDVYEYVALYEPTANGLLSMARLCRRIYDHERPVCEYDESGQVVSVSVKFLVPSYKEPRWETVTFSAGHFMKWRRASHNKNGRGKQDANNETMNYAGSNYTSFNGGIDPEFAGTKAIIHGLNKRGMNMNEVVDQAPIQNASHSKMEHLPLTRHTEHEEIPHRAEPEVTRTIALSPSDDINPNEM